MIDSRTREIRAILIGWVRYVEGVCIASESLSGMQFQGLNNGASAARIRGIKELRRQYIVPKRLIRDRDEFGRILRTMGRVSYLFSSPNAMVTLCRPFLFLAPPVLVTIEIVKGNQLLCCFDTAKVMFPKLRLRHVIKKLRMLLPSETQQTEVTVEPYVEEAEDKQSEEPEDRQSEGAEDRQSKGAEDRQSEEAEDRQSEEAEDGTKPVE